MIKSAENLRSGQNSAQKLDENQNYRMKDSGLQEGPSVGGH